MKMTFESINYVFLISDKSVHLFDYYKVDDLHGLKRKDCLEYSETKDDAYIAGMSNLAPDGTKPYVFINKSRLKGDYRDATLIMHEMMHLSLLRNTWNIDDDEEEEIITWAETETNWLMENLITHKYCKCGAST